MSWRAEGFRDHFLARLGSEEDAYHHAMLLRRIDRHWGGLDEKIGEVGLAHIMAWARAQRTALFHDAELASRHRAALNCYVKFLIDDGDPDAAHPIMTTTSDIAGKPDESGLIREERTLQSAVRRDLDMLEPGLVAIDGGYERIVPTGRIDILARDRDGHLVVIELKAGLCPSDAIEQALGYSEDIARETGQPCRTMIVAGRFSDRTRTAARRIPGLMLAAYRQRLHFAAID